MSDRKPRTRTFGPVVVTTGRRDGDPHGSVVRFAGRAWRLEAWPHRVVAATPRGEAVALTLRDGTQRLLEPIDAETA